MDAGTGMECQAKRSRDVREVARGSGAGEVRERGCGVNKCYRDVTTVTEAAPLQQGRLLLSVLEAEPNKGDEK
jgi:hypothetical protein